MKMDYTAVKVELAKSAGNTKHFTKAFFKAFADAKAKRAKTIENGEADADMYVIRPEAPICLYHSFDEVYNSDFYTKNGSAYCVFLEIIYGNELVA